VPTSANTWLAGRSARHNKKFLQKSFARISIEKLAKSIEAGTS